MNRFSSAILSWYAAHARDLPWRRTDDPYRILVSEVMLQQTQVERVVPKYLAFLQAFPDAESLAYAKTSKVITLWSGLGYNRRAVNLQKAAQELARGVPTTHEGWMRLPGVGPYTASAIQAFAFHQDVAVVDTNIRRIFSRHFFGGKGDQAMIEAKAGAHVPAGEGTSWNNALMDFGSLVCTAFAPSCGSCPVRSSCKAYQNGTQEAFLRAPRQSRFEGSNRQYRGLVLRMLKDAPGHALAHAEVRKRLNKPAAFVHAIVRQLEQDGLVASDDEVRLP